MQTSILSNIDSGIINILHKVGLTSPIDVITGVILGGLIALVLHIKSSRSQKKQMAELKEELKGEKDLYQLLKQSVTNANENNTYITNNIIYPNKYSEQEKAMWDGQEIEPNVARGRTDKAAESIKKEATSEDIGFSTAEKEELVYRLQAQKEQLEVVAQKEKIVHGKTDVRTTDEIARLEHQISQLRK